MTEGAQQIDMYLSTGSLKLFVFCFALLAIAFAGLLGTLLPLGIANDPSVSQQIGTRDLIFVALCGWFIGAFFMFVARRQYLNLKRAKTPISFTPKGITGLMHPKRPKETSSVSWENVTKVVKSNKVPGTRRSLHADRMGTITVFYGQEDGQDYRHMIDWAQFGVIKLKSYYEPAHQFIASHVSDSCELEAHPGPWSKS